MQALNSKLPERTSSHGLVLVVDDDEAVGSLVSRWLRREGYSVQVFREGEPCLAALAWTTPDAICLDLQMPGLSGLKTLERIRTQHGTLPVIIITADSAVETVVCAMQLGACDYLTKPLDFSSLSARLKTAVSRYRMPPGELASDGSGAAPAKIVGASAPMRHVYRQVDLVAQTDVSVVIYGESGTGKELVARAIHDQSDRGSGPFVAINCAAIPESLQESELFGHERGAFSGAIERRQGRFEQAHRGTLFLDEVAELSLSLQSKLLRVLQERSFQRVGGSAEIKSDFRLVAATHRDLDREIEAGRFREDLFFRIAVFELPLPPLRERRDDILPLAEHFLTRFAMARGRPRCRLSPEASEWILAHDWPGNVRELRNTMDRAAVVAVDGFISPEHLGIRVQALPRILDRPKSTLDGPKSSQVDEGRRFRNPNERVGGSENADWVEDLPSLNLAELEQRAIEAAVRRAGGNLSKVVRLLGIGRTTLYRRLKKYGLHRE